MGGARASKRFDTPATLETDKKYFRIAKDSTFLCKTLWFPESRDRTGRVYKEHSQFHCTMQIDSDIEAFYKKREDLYTFSHPEFGVERIVDTKMKIDILVDEKNCKKVPDKKGNRTDYFRELKKSN